MEAQSIDLIEEFHSEDVIAPANRSVNHSKLIHRLSVSLNRYEDQYDILPELELELATGKCKPDVSIFNNLSVDWLNDVIFIPNLPSLLLRFCRLNKHLLS